MKLLRRMTLTAFIGSAVFCLTSCNPKIDKSVSVDCSGFAFTTEIMTFLDHRNCGHQDAEGMMHIMPDTMKLFKPDEFNSNFGERDPKGLRCFPFRVSDRKVDFGYLAADGRARISDDPHDNGCQPFGNGVAISYVDGKTVFFDKDLKVVKATDYALADPFYKHLAKVCTLTPIKEYDVHGEHFKWVGGTCGYIDTDYNVVVPIATSYETTQRLTGGKYDGEKLVRTSEP